MASTQTGIIAGTIAGKKGDNGEVEVRISWKAIPRSDNSGHDVSFDLQTRETAGGSSTTYDNNPDYLLKIAGTTVYEKTNDRDHPINYKNYTSGTWYTIISAPSTFIAHTAAKTINLYGYFYINSTYVDSGTVSGNITLSALTTACTAPSTVTANASIKPQGTAVTISWSAGGAGTANAISGYRIFWQVGANPTLSSYTSYKDVGPSTTSTTVTMSGARGNTYYFKVQTLGSVSGYSSGISSDNAVCSVNQLPPAPTVVLNYTQVPSTGVGTVKASTLLATDVDGQTCSYYYSTSSSGTKTKITTSSSISINSTSITTLYFWSYDGLEYSSSYTTKTVTCVARPTVSLSVSGKGTKYTTKDYDYYTSYILTATPSAGSGVYRYYYKIDDGEWIAFGSSTTSSKTYTVSDVTSLCPAGKSIYFDVGYYQSIDYSNYNTGAWDSTKAYYIPTMPTLGDIFNNNSTSDLVDTSNNYFYNYIRAYFSKDTGISSVSLSTSPAGTVSTSNNFSSSSPYVLLNTSELTGGTSYNFTITLKRNSHSQAYTFSRTKILNINFGSIDSTNNYIRPHLSNDQIKNTFNDSSLGNNGYFTISFPNILGLNESDNGELYKYGLSSINIGDETTPIYTIKNLQLTTTCNGITYSFPQDDYAFISNTDNDYLEVNVKSSFLQDMIDTINFGITDYNGSYIFSFGIYVYSNFLIEQSSNKKYDITLDFDVPLKYTEQSLIIEYKSGLDIANPDISKEDGWNKIKNGVLLRKGDKIKYTYKWSTYNTYKIPFYGYIKRSSISSDENNDGYMSDEFWGVDVQTTVSPIRDNNPIGKLLNSSISIEREILTITESKYIYFKANISQIINNITINNQDLDWYFKTNTPEYNINYGISVQHNTSIIEISKGLYSDSNSELEGDEISFSYSCSDIGLDTINNELDGFSAEVYIQYSSDENFLEDKTKSLLIEKDYNNFETADDIIEYSGNEWADKNSNFFYVRLKLITVDSGQTNDATNPLISYSNIIVIYNTTPTISYRQNCLGLNYKLPVGETNDVNLSSAFLVIGETSRKNQIYFVSSDGINALSGGTWDEVLE